MIWDLSQIDKPSTDEMRKNGPPEMLLALVGHISKISGFAWNKNETLKSWRAEHIKNPIDLADGMRETLALNALIK